MYQLKTKLRLWDLPNHFQEDIGRITLRGNSSEPPVILPAEYSLIRLKGIRPLSVEKISRDFCPIRRDLFLEIRNHKRNYRSIWGQAAGNFIESYFTNMLVHFSVLAENPKNLTYQKIEELSEAYSNSFWDEKKKLAKQLEEKATSAVEKPEKLKFLLQQTAKYELLMLKTDYALRPRGSKYGPYSKKFELILDKKQLCVRPKSKLGLSEITTPDFLIKQPVVIMGEVKTGKSLQQYHLNAVAGFALAYESQYNIPVNYGMIYFFETHNDTFSFAQTYTFVINDFLRRKFLDQRNKVYSILLGNKPRITKKFQKKYYEDCCSHCKYKENCYPNGQ